MQHIDILNFQGLKTGLTLPPVGSALTLRNFVRHKLRGALQFTNGYDRKVFGEIAVTYSGAAPVIATSANNHGLHEDEWVIARNNAGVLIGTYQITVTGLKTLTLDGTTGAGAGTGTLELISLPQPQAAIYKTSAFSIIDVKNFKIAEKGGRNITVVAGTYTKNGYRLPSCADITRMGVWINPWYDLENSVWVEGWQELTEMWQFEIRELGAGADDHKLFIDYCTGGGVWDFDFRNVIDPQGKVFADNYPYFKGWTIVYNGFGDDENYDKVIYSGFQSDVYYLAVPHNVAAFASRVAGTPISVYRNFCTKELPSSITTWIVKLFNEIRLTTGRETTDISLFAGFKDKTFIAEPVVWDGVLPDYNGEVLSGIYAGESGFSEWEYALIATMYSGADAAGIPPGTYYLKFALVSDDGQVGTLKNVINNWAGAPIAYTTTGTRAIVLAADSFIGIAIGKSIGTLPRWAKYIRFYISTDDVTYNRIKDIDLTDSAIFTGTVVVAAAVEEVAVTKPDTTVISHIYSRSNIVKLFNVDYLAIGSEASVDIGRAITDAGALPYTVRQIVGKKSLIADVLAGGVVQQNKVFVSAANGTGDMQYDVNPNDPDNIIDLDYNDGDEIVAIVPTTGDRFVVMKRRRLVLVEPNGRGGYNRIVLSENVGLTSQKAVVTRDARNYFPDYSGIYRYSPNGLELLNKDWLETWKSVSAANKEAAVSVIDEQNKMWLMFCGGKVYKYDLIDGEWTIDELADAVTAVAEDMELPTGIDFIGAGKLNTFGSAVLMDNVAFTGTWESNKIEPLINAEGDAVDIVPQYLIFEHEANISISVNVYLDDNAAAFGSTYTLSASDKKTTIGIALGARCKGMRIKVSATKAAAANAVLIKKCFMYYETVGTTRSALTA